MALFRVDQLSQEAKFRQEELLAEAERRRLVKMAKAGQPSLGQRLFSSLGGALFGRGARNEAQSKRAKARRRATSQASKPVDMTVV